jgi:hypothetical protein
MSEVKLKRSEMDDCFTYRDTAFAISKIEYSIGSPEWLDLASRKIKRHGHHMKLSVYSRVLSWIYGFKKDEPLSLDDAKFAVVNLKSKVETHLDYCQRSDEEIM